MLLLQSEIPRMKKLVFTTLIVFFASFILRGQEIILKGIYQGKNLYVLNSAIDLSKNIFCVNAVYVNDVITEDEINSNSFEIDFTNLKIPIGQKVVVKILYKTDCKPEIINANVLESTTEFTIATPKIDKKTSKLIWTISGNIDDKPFIVEQLRWEKWIIVGEVQIKDSVGENNFTFDPKLNSKQNTFRIRHIDKSGNERISKECKYFSKDEELYLLSNRVSDWLYFSSETLYEVFDEKGNFILDGYGKEVNFSDIEKGKYWVNYDNRTEIITKK